MPITDTPKLIKGRFIMKITLLNRPDTRIFEKNDALLNFGKQIVSTVLKDKKNENIDHHHHRDSSIAVLLQYRCQCAVSSQASRMLPLLPADLQALPPGTCIQETGILL
jgi:hypothetical protein